MRFAVILATLSLAQAGAAEEPQGKSQNGVLVSHLMFGCNGHGRRRQWPMAVDSQCLSTPGMGLQVLEAAVCANGTRAKLARFTGSRCSSGADDLVAVNTLVDVADADVGRDSCLPTLDELKAADGTTAKVGSVAFVCDPSAWENRKAKDEEKPAAGGGGSRAGGVSHNACPSPRHRATAPIFEHPRPDTCRRLPAGRRLRVEAPATCADGARARLARFRGLGCGAADALPLLDMTDGETVKQCLEWAGGDDYLETSYGFLCDGIEVGGDAAGPRRGRGSGLLGLALVLCVLSLLAVLGCVTVATRWARLVERVMDLIKRTPDNGIRL